MIKNYYLALLVFSGAFSHGQVTDLIISEYVEGSSNNKYIEVFNGTGSSVNLTDYQLNVFSNGASSPTQSVTLIGILANNTTIVYSNSSTSIYGGATTDNAAIIFNGNDALALYKLSTASYVDIFGVIGDDPGSAWTATGYSTANRTLVRKSTICGGVTVNPSGMGNGGFTTLSTEWDLFAQNTVSNLGSHTISCVIGPEIEIQGNSTEIVNGDITPDISDHTDFGITEVSGGSVIRTFTILNTGGSDLSLTGTPRIIVTPSTEFIVTNQPSLTTLSDTGVNASTTFQITFNPMSLGTHTASVNIENDDGNENPYTFTVVGSGTNSNQSSILDNTNYSTLAPEFNSNTAYIDFTDGTTVATGKFIPMKLRILDGPDTDSFDTKLTAISFTVEDLSNTNQLAMLKTALLTTTSGTPITATLNIVGNTLAFSGMNSASLTATDDHTSGQIFHLRASFDETQVIDRTKLVFKVTSATADASGSSFTVSDAGGAETDTGNNNRNRLNVTADRLAFATQPADTSVSMAMAPAPVVSLTDSYGRIDLDLSGTITMTSTGLPNTQPNGPISNGQAAFNTVNHTGAGGAFNLVAHYSGWSVTSAPFFISNVVSGSYRTTSNGTWHSTTGSGTATWQEFTGSWTPMANQPSTSTTNPVFIRHEITLVGTNTASDLTIDNGGNFRTSTVSATFTNILVKTGGRFKKEANGIKINGFLEVENGGTVTFRHTNTTSRTTNFWNGTERFHEDSNFIIETTDNVSNFLVIETNAEVSEFNGGCFGNVILDNSAGQLQLLPSGFNKTLCKGDLIFRNHTTNLRVSNGNYATTIKGDLIIESTFNEDITFLTTNGNCTIHIEGDLLHEGPQDLRLANSQSSNAPNVTLNIDGDLILNGGVLRFDIGSSNASFQPEINLKGDITVSNSGLIYSDNLSQGGQFNFSGLGDGLTDATTQTIDIAATNHTLENKNIDFDVLNGAYVKQINRDFQLGQSSSLVVDIGATYDFGFNGTTALNLTISGAQPGTNFSSRTGSTLKITSPNGITTTANLGNVQTLPSGRSFNQTANFYYVGKQNQVTGNALTVGSTVKNVYAILDTNNLELRLSNRTGIADGGKLEIQQGIVIGEEIGVNDNDFYGPDGQLVMTGGEYRISTITTNQLTDFLPQLRNYSSYVLTGGIIHLNGFGFNNTQILSGVPNYINLAFSGSNTLAALPPLPPGLPTYKGISSGANVSNNITLSEDAILDIKDNSLGGSGTNLIMKDQSRFIMAGAGTKPNATGSYTLDPNTTIAFNSNGSFESIRLTNPVPSYANIVISGDNVGTTADGTGANSFIQFQPNGSFTVTGAGTFKQSNSFGFSGGASTSISSTNNPTIELLNNSTVEYAGAAQVITAFTTTEYKNLRLSGTGIKSLGHPTAVLVGEDLNMVSATLNIGTGEAITVDEGVILTGGNMTIEDSGSLVQINETDTNSGNITMKRNAFIENFDYVYWSTPVSGFNTDNLFQSTSSNIFYWDPIVSNIPFGGTGQGYWRDASNQPMETGKGYIAKAPNYSSLTQDETLFNNGVPNNGSLHVTISRGSDNDGLDGDDDDDDWNLVGNPYPSAISANAFLLENSVGASAVIAGYIDIWTHGNAPSNISDPFYENNGGFNYNENDYVRYNYLGATLQCGPNGVDFSNNPLGYSCFNGHIAAGQGFMVNMVDGGPVTQNITLFKNAMRSQLYDNSAFFRSSGNVTEQSEEHEERHRMWLDLASENNGVKRILIGYATNATMERDILYDAKVSNTENTQNFYSIIDNTSFNIQGRALPFTDTDVIPLGFNNLDEGNFTIAIAAVDGVFENEQAIYLKDNFINNVHHLSEAPYTFTSETGEFNNRFEIVFKAEALSIADNQMDSNQLTISELDHGDVQFKIRKNLNITAVEILDVTGRQVYKLKGNTSTEIFNLSQLSKAPYIAKVTLSNGQVIRKKAIKQH
jgi:hypothetical protein